MFLSFCLCLYYFCVKSNLGDSLYLWKFSPSLKLQVNKYLFPWNLPLSSLSPSPTLAHCPLYQSLPFINLWHTVVCVYEKRENPSIKQKHFLHKNSELIHAYIYAYMKLSKCLLNRKAFLTKTSTAQTCVNIPWSGLPKGSFLFSSCGVHERC